MPKINEVKKSAVIELDGAPHVIRDVEVKSPSARGASTLYKFKLTNVRSGQLLERTFKGDEFVKDADFARRSAQFLFQADDEWTFMDVEDYSQFTFNTGDLGEQIRYLSDGLEGIIALVVDGQAIGIELPQSVVMEITDTAPGIKGASASARTKPATLSSGLEIQVPEYLETGETVKVNTESGKFMSRAT